MAVLTIDQNNFETEVLGAEQPVLVDFWAEWCGPCRMLAPVIEKLAKRYEGKMKVGKLNVDENNALAGQYGVMSIPTLLLFKNGEPVERFVGFAPEKELAHKIDAALG